MVDSGNRGSACYSLNITTDGCGRRKARQPDIAPAPLRTAAPSQVTMLATKSTWPGVAAYSLRIVLKKLVADVFSVSHTSPSLREIARAD